MEEVLTAALDWLRFASAVGFGVFAADILLGVIVAYKAKAARKQALGKLEAFAEQYASQLPTDLSNPFAEKESESK